MSSQSKLHTVIFFFFQELNEKKNTFTLLAHRIDTNDNGYVSVDELRNWIISKVKEHIQGALRENIFLFTAIDTDPRNGAVSWDEYHAWFLKKNGINSTEFESPHDEHHAELSRNLRGWSMNFHVMQKYSFLIILQKKLHGIRHHGQRQLKQTQNF